MEWYLGPLKKYAEFSGRASRKEYWLFTLGQFVIGFLLALLIPVLYPVFVLGTLLPALAVAVRRLHDTNRSGWWLFIVLVPFVGGIVMFVFLVLEGTSGDNDYGPDPLALVATPPGPVVTGPGSTPAIPPSGPAPPSEIRQPTSSSDALGAPPPPYQERPTIKMKPESIPEAPDQPDT